MKVRTASQRLGDWDGAVVGPFRHSLTVALLTLVLIVLGDGGAASQGVNPAERPWTLPDDVGSVRAQMALPGSLRSDLFARRIREADALGKERDFDAQEALLRDLLSWPEIDARRRHPARAVVLTKLAQTLTQRNREPEALAMLSDARAILKANIRIERKLKAGLFHAAAQTYERLGRFDLSEAAYREAYAIEVLERRSHPDTALAADEWGQLDHLIEYLLRRQKFDVAQGLAEADLARATTAADLILSHFRLANIALSSAHPDLAVSALRSAIAIIEAHSPSPDIAIAKLAAYTQLATALHRAGRSDEAKNVVQLYLASERANGTLDDDLAASALFLLGRSLAGMEVDDIAAEALQQSLDLRRSHPDEDDTELQQTAIDLAMVQLRRGQKDKAVGVLRETLPADCAVLKDVRPPIQIALTRTLSRAGERDAAETNARAYVTCLKAKRPAPPRGVLASAHSELAYALSAQGRTEEALMESFQALLAVGVARMEYTSTADGMSFDLAIRSPLPADADPELGYSVLSELVMLLLKAGAIDEGAQFSQLRTSIALQAFGRRSLEYAEASVLSASLLIAVRRPEDAKAPLGDALLAMNSHLDAPPSLIAELRSMATLGYLSIGNLPEARATLAPLRARLDQLDQEGSAYWSVTSAGLLIDINDPDPVVALAAARRLTALWGGGVSEEVGDIGVLQKGLTLASGTILQGPAWRQSRIRPDENKALFAEVFAAAQYSEPIQVGDAMRRSSARLLASNAGAEAEWLEWNAAQKALDAAEAVSAARSAAAFMESSAEMSADAVGRRVQQTFNDLNDRAPTTTRASAAARLSAAETALKNRLPDLFDVLRPSSVPVSALQGGPQGPALLGPDEALILLTQTAGNLPGIPQTDMVMVVTREEVAWAPISFGASELSDAIALLHRGLRTGSMTRGMDEGSADAATYPLKVAHDLYNGLFGSAEVAALLQSKHFWLIAPQGKELISLPYSALLISSPPSQTSDVSPEVLRDLKWLGLERAISIVPSISALRAQRRPQGVRRPGTRPFFGIGNPDLPGVAPVRRRRAFNPLTDAFDFDNREGVVATVSQMPKLPFTAGEIRRLASHLKGSSDSYLLGADATEREFRRRYAAGDVANADVLAFATHGLIGGGRDAVIDEPSLVLTPPLLRRDDKASTDNDGLLTQSEISSMPISARWVILSACNTAAGGSPNAPALSGLARAFLYAGAQSLLVSYWPVQDESAAELTTLAVELNQQGQPAAEALRLSMRKLWQDKTRDRSRTQPSNANPTVWAPFMLIGASAAPD